METKIVFIGNYKGGVGKTTSVLNFAEHFTKMGKKVLVLDLDPILDRQEYDLVLIDCPPSNNLMTRSAFLLSDYYIIPTVLDRVSANGVAHYINTVNKTYDKYCNDPEDGVLSEHYFGKKPRLIGIFCTFIRGQVYYESAMRNLEDTISKNCGESEDEVYFFEEEINNYIDIARSTEIGQSSKARKDYEALSRRVLERINEMESE